MEKPELISRYKCYEGWVEFYRHFSTSCQFQMRFSVYRPPQANTRKVPVLYWLSGLTCTEENFMIKSGAQAHAAANGLMIVAPDTSPRGTGIEGEDKEWDFGSGAGFYVNATEPKWSRHFRMYDYVNEELPAIIRTYFPAIPDRESISGHSMGGHGALVSALSHPGRYLSVSAFSPICAPTLCPWGQKAFSGFLGESLEARDSWARYDASSLVADGRSRQPLFIDQGGDDKFLLEQLMPLVLKEACEKAGHPLQLRMQPGYDHSYYFIQSFIQDHIEYHAGFLNA